MAFSEGIKVFFGGDTTQLRASLSEANVLVDSFAKGIKKSGIDLGKGFGLGILITQFRQLGQEAIEQAQKARDEWEKTGKPIDAATKSLASFGDGLKAVKQGAVDAVGFLLSGYTQLGELIGSTINRIRGIDEAQENTMEGIARETEKTLARIAEARKKYEADNTPEKRAEREKKALADTEKAWQEYLKEVGKLQDAEAEKIARRKKADYDLQQKADAAHLDAVKINLEILTLEAKAKRGLTEQERDRLKVLMAQTAEIVRQEEITVLLSLNKRSPEEDARLQLLIRQSAEYANQLSLIRETVGEEKKKTEELKQQLGAIEGIRGGADFNDASDSTLKEIARRNRYQAQTIRFNPSNQGIGQSLEAARYEAEAMNAEAELRFRRKFQLDFSVGGEALARKNFQGDPLKFDRIADQLVKNQTTAEKTLTVQEDILEALTRRGILTFPSKNPPTGP